YPDVVYRYRPGPVESHTLKGNTIRFISENRVELNVEVVSDHIIRLNYLMEGDLRTDFSYALDPSFNSEEVDFSFEEKTEFFELTTGALICRITREKMLVHFYDAEGQVLCEEEHGFYRRDSLLRGISEVKVTKKAPDDLRFFGLGDKPHELNLRGRAFENWNTDSFAYERGDDPLYRSIPFYMGLIGNRAYGIFFDNTYRTRFSFDRRNNRVSSFSATGGQINYYFIAGPSLDQVAMRYTRLTGTPEMPPLWALGYHQCRWSYYPEEEVRTLADTFRERQIPCDAIYLDIDYMDEYRCFTWNYDHFPDPASLISDLKKQGFQTILMIDPGIKIDEDYHVYKSGMENGHFCRRPDGELMIAPVWPPRCVFPDFTDPEVRAWWGDLYDDFIADLEVSGIWNDMNEPAVFEINKKTFPDDIRHNFDGHPCSHKKAHNIYGMQMARASLEGMKKHAPGKRPFLLTRANYSGGQRYAALWTGDNISDWDHLKLANLQCQRLSISGYSFVGSDIGGFVEIPDGELFTRWLQLAVFHPLFRNHTMGYNVDGAGAVDQQEVAERESTLNTNQEPWSFGEKYTDVNKQTIELRYRLLSYLYSAFWKYVNEGRPILLPLTFYDQHDEQNEDQEDQFMFGDQILAAPVLEKGKTKKKLYLPTGGWYHFWDHRFYEGKQTLKVDAPIEQVPFFVKAGTILPLRPVMQHVHEKEPERMELNIYFGKESAQSFIYEDAGEGYDFRDGVFMKSYFNYEWNEDQQRASIAVQREGTYRPSYGQIDLRLIGFPDHLDALSVDGSPVECSMDPGSEVRSCTVEAGFDTIEIHVG
ncbi:MAG: glycoside hydrolase family 31 protein, partial [Balneolaceae bacterium]|nr:glycoside hydrolase family 31 protein [Balneolaceae bacterium]